jgi:hypothetical protein
MQQRLNRFQLPHGQRLLRLILPRPVASTIALTFGDKFAGSIGLMNLSKSRRVSFFLNSEAGAIYPVPVSIQFSFHALSISQITLTATSLPIPYSKAQPPR